LRGDVRVTFRFKENKVEVEKLVEIGVGLTIGEITEMERLQEELSDQDFSDFATAEQMTDPARKELMRKKQRLEELKEQDGAPRFVWEKQEMPESVFAIYQPDRVITYVENMDAWMIDKMMEQPNINIYQSEQFPQQHPIENEPDYEYKKEREKEVSVLPGRTLEESNAISVLVDAGIKWDEFVTVKQEEKLLTISPHKFLGDDWRPINTALKAEYGDHWVTDGKRSRWEIPLK
jgi:hypothetical protein